VAKGARRQIEALQRQVKAVVARVGELEAENAALKVEVANLRARLGMNSQNSSKPPSSDGPAAPPRPPPSEPSKRKPGGQPGHTKHERGMVPPERVDRAVAHRPDECAGCGDGLPRDGGEISERHQIWELPEIQAEVTEHQCWAVRCANCDHVTVAGLPADVPRGCFGPRLMAVLAVLCGRFRLSRREVAVISESLFNIPISIGSVAKTCATAAKVFAAPVAEVRAVVQAARMANADETGFKCAGQKGWLWVVVVTGATLFHLAQSRGSKVIKALLDGFVGRLGTDRWSGYNWFELERRQLCWAHIKRNLRAVYERGGYGIGLGQQGGELVPKIFDVWHRCRDGPREHLRAAMLPLQNELRELLESHRDCRCQKARNFAQELLDVWPALWTFVDVEGVEPTNNSAERAIRPAVLWRKGCFGTQSEDGARFTEGILTIAATCKQRGRPLLTYVTELFEAHASGRPAPRLIAQA
jgi:transposase